MQFLGWVDDSAKKDAPTKIGEAVAAYQQRFSAAPNLVWVWAGCECPATVAGCRVERKTFVRPGNVLVGYEA